MIPSPCIQLCRLDTSVEPARCIGCGRTPEQIGLWGSANDEQRLAILDDADSFLRDKVFTDMVDAAYFESFDDPD